MEKDKYSLLQYECIKYIFDNFNPNQNNFNQIQNSIQIIVYNLYILTL